jgi:hypothetical protein
VRGAGLSHRTPYAMRHTYAAFSIAAGVSLFHLARRMGTSVEMIDERYGHLLPDAGTGAACWTRSMRDPRSPRSATQTFRHLSGSGGGRARTKSLHSGLCSVRAALRS